MRNNLETKTKKIRNININKSGPGLLDTNRFRDQIYNLTNLFLFYILIFRVNVCFKFQTDVHVDVFHYINEDVIWGLSHLKLIKIKKKMHLVQWIPFFIFIAFIILNLCISIIKLLWILLLFNSNQAS